MWESLFRKDNMENQADVQDLISQGIALMSAENYEAAKAVFQEAAEIEPESAEIHSHLGNVFANLEQYDAALDEFRKILIIDPDNGEAYFSIGSVYVLEDDLVMAIEYYNKAEALGFKEPVMYKTMARIFLEENDIPQALRNINRAIEADPLDGELRVSKAEILISRERYAEALECLDELEKIHPDAFEAYGMRADIYAGLKRYDEAVAVCDQGIARFPEDPNLAEKKLKVLAESGRGEKAAEWIAAMKSSGLYEQAMPESAIEEAVLFLQKNDFTGAAGVLEEALKQSPDDMDLVYLLLDIYGKTNQLDKVLPLSEKLMAEKENIFYRATALYYHAFALENLGREKEAIPEYRRVVREVRGLTIDNPGFYEGYIFRLLAHTALGEFEKALDLAEYIENINPESGDSHAFRFFIYQKMGDREKAAQEARLANQMKPAFHLNEKA